MSKDKLQWITISSEQAILMSVCLQSLVDELLMKKNGVRKKKYSFKGNWTYMKRDGSSHLISVDDFSVDNKVWILFYEYYSASIEEGINSFKNRIYGRTV